MAAVTTWGRRRTDFVNTVFSLSRGWQMRSPVHVRQSELVASLRGRCPRADQVITLEPDVLFVEPSEPPTAPDDFPIDLRDLHRRLTSVSALYAAMIDREQIEQSEARAKAQKWADVHQALAAHLRMHAASKHDTRVHTTIVLLSDLRDELASAARRARLGGSALEAWIEREIPDALSRMPYLGHFYEILYERLRNAEDKWERNDLVDMHFLACAAGYADVVAGERKTSALLLRASRRLPSGAHVTPTLAGAVQHLEEALL